jgi:hypothetical protein
MSILKAKHWKNYGAQAEFEVKLAAQNSPPMEMDCKHQRNAIRLVQEAYNLIKLRRLPSSFPGISIFGVYDFQTTDCIGKFQDFFTLVFRDGRAGKETIMKMDEVLVEIEIENTQFKPPVVYPWEVILGL